MKQRLNRARQAGPSFEQSTFASLSRPALPAKKDHRSAKHSSYTPVLSATALTITLIALHLYTRNNNAPLHPARPRNLLDLHKTSHLPPCNAYRISLKDVSTPYPPAGDKPTIYTDWRFDNRGLDTTTSFIQQYGHIPQFIKMGDALPLFNQAGALCIMPFRILIASLIRKFIDTSYIIQTKDGGLPPVRETNADLLIFTNQQESPALFDTILHQYDTPKPLSFTKNYIPPPGELYGWTKIFSALMQRSSHRFHIHHEAWLGQISGSRLWFLLPPSTSSKNVEYKPPACEYLYNRESLPSGAMACIQTPGEVMYLPKNWWHATCGLEEWNVGVGEQLHAPAMDAPAVPVEERTEEEWEVFMEECLEGGAFNWQL